ncbi:hypothetical protein IAT38_008071 [Cryptococcus sp. DSM 104549]
MGFFGSRKTSSAPGTPFPASPSTTSLSISPLPPAQSFGRTRRTAASSRAASPLPPADTISLRVAIDPAPLGGKNEAAKELFYVSVSPEESVAALRRDIARTLGYNSMSVFKVSIPWQAHQQACTYTDLYDKRVDLLAGFSAFNMDDPLQLETSLAPEHKSMGAVAVANGDLKMKHWFPNHAQTDVISVVARPLRGVPVYSQPLTLRCYFATPPPLQRSPSLGSRSLAGTPSPSPTARPPPLVVDASPYITVDELKMELMAAAGKDVALWKHAVLWQIAMTESEMVVIDELGRLKNGKMPWPYPPGAMEPISLSDGSLPICLFFPKSAPNGDMLNLSVWFNPPSTGSPASQKRALKDASTPPFRYPMHVAPVTASPISVAERERRASFIASLTSPMASPMERVSSSPTVGTPVAELFPVPLKAKNVASRGKRRPSTAPTVLVSDSSAPIPENSMLAPPAHINSYSLSPRASPAPLTSSGRLTKSPKGRKPQGLGIAVPPPTANLPVVDRGSFSSMEDDSASVPSLESSRQSLDTPVGLGVRTPDTADVIGMDWLAVGGGGEGLQKARSMRQGSLSAMMRKTRIA